MPEQLARAVSCRSCGGQFAAHEAVVTSGLGDPLVVTECPTCGSILGIGGHSW